MRILSLFLIVSGLMGCATQNRSQHSMPLDASVEAKLKADITVDMNKKLKGQASSTTLFGFFQISGPNNFADGVFAQAGGLGAFLGGGDEKLKAAAAYNAVKAGNAQIIVAPQYVINKSDYYVFSTTNVQVTGYAGTLDGIHK